MQVEHDQLVGTSSSGARRADGGHGAAQAAISSRDSEERAELERLRKAARAPTWPKRARPRLQQSQTGRLMPAIAIALQPLSISSIPSSKMAIVS